jgi:hypothetical protein
MTLNTITPYPSNYYIVNFCVVLSHIYLEVYVWISIYIFLGNSITLQSVRKDLKMEYKFEGFHLALCINSSSLKQNQIIYGSFVPIKCISFT